MMIGPERRREPRETAKKGKKARKSKKRAAVEPEPAADAPPAEPVATAESAVAAEPLATAELAIDPEPAASAEPAPTAIALLPHVDRLRAQVDALLVAAAPVSAPAAPAARADAVEPSDGPPPPLRSAVLVARELLQRGMPAERVRERLAAGYGVEDPDAVLAAAGAA